MQDFDIRPIPEEEIYRAQCYIDQIAKPLGAMGKLETLAARLAALQDTLQPSLSPREHFVFAADHGIETEGVSKSPREITSSPSKGQHLSTARSAEVPAPSSTSLR